MYYFMQIVNVFVWWQVWYPDNIPSGQNPLCSFLHRWTKSPSCILQGGHNPLWNFLQDGHNPPRDFYKVDKIPSIRWTKSPSDKIPLADYCHRNGTRMVDETVSIGHTLCSLKTDRINLKRSFLYIMKQRWLINRGLTTCVNRGTTGSSILWDVATHHSGLWLTVWERMQLLWRLRCTTTSRASQLQRGPAKPQLFTRRGWRLCVSFTRRGWRLCQQCVREEKTLAQHLYVMGQQIRLH